jgi:predicted metal-dependent peptidase
MAEQGSRYRRLSPWEGSVWSKTIESLLLPKDKGGYGLYPLSPIFALLMPFVDITCETAYTDVRARVGLGLQFFYKWDNRLRAFALAHEALHVANRHFQRADECGKTFEHAHRMMNLAGDMEINELLLDMGVAHSKDEDAFVFPSKWGYERSRTMEEYLASLSLDWDKLEELARMLEELQNRYGGGKDGSSGAGEGQSSDSDESGSGSEGSQGGESDKQGGAQSGSQGSGRGSGHGGAGSADKGADPGQGGGSGSSGSGGEGSKGGGSQSGDADSQGKNCSGEQSDSQGESGSEGDGKGDWTSQYVRANVGHACGSRSNSEDDREGERIEGETGVRGRAMADVEGARQDAEALVREAADGSNSMGSGAGDSWVRLLARMAPPRVNWQSVLAGVVGRSMSSRVRGNRYATYKRPNRRRQGGEFVWPSREDNKPTVHVAVDTSGSMGRDDYAHAVGEIEGILRASASGAAIGFYGVDTQMSERPRMVSHVRDLKAFGGGGTDMSVPYEWMAGEWAAGGKRRRELPDVHVLVTDGWVDWGETLVAAAKCRQFTRMVIVVTSASESKRVIEDGRAVGVSVVFVNG